MAMRFSALHAGRPLPPGIFLLFIFQGDAVEQWLRYYATRRKVARSKPDEVNEFVSIYLILPAALSSGVYSASNRNEYHKQRNISGE
jgi:hypothetical protein